MKEKRIVVALGRNAFGETFPEQKKNVKKAAQAIADLVEQKYQIVITHSNGPQVGMIQTAMTEFARLDNDKNYTVAPMSLCGAMSIKTPPKAINTRLENSPFSKLSTACES